MSAPDTVPGLGGRSGECEIPRRSILGGATLLLAGGASRRWSVAAEPPRRREFIIVRGNDTGRLDPHRSTSIQDTMVSFNLFDTLVSRRPDGRLTPALATRWELVDPTTWRFRLRTGVRFHDGDPLTAADVKFSIERTLDPTARVLVAASFATVAQVTAPDPYTVLFHTSSPDPLLPARLAAVGGQIIPKRYVETVGPDAFNARPVGSGPVRFVEWVKDDRLVLEAVPDYWDGRIDPDLVVFRAIPEPAARLAALLRGEADIIAGLPPDHVQRVVQHPRTRVEEVLYAGFVLIVLDSRRPPLDRPKVKQALSLALDRSAILNDLWHGRGLIPTGPIPRGDDYYEEALPPLRYDPALARQRLAEAGYGGELIVLESSPGHLPNDRTMSEAVLAMWRDVGLNVQMETVEASIRAQRIRERSSKGLRWSLALSSVGDPDGMMWRLLGPGGIMDHWRHPRFDELGHAAQVSHDRALRARAYREMTTIFLEHLPWIPVIQPVEAYGVQRFVEWRAHPNQRIEVRRFNLRLHRA